MDNNLNDRTISNVTKVAHQRAIDAGWWDGPEREVGTLLMLMVSELAEGLEADRANTPPVKSSELKEILNEVDIESFRILFKGNIKDTLEDELADTVIRIMDFCGGRGIDLETHIIAKMRYNATRGYKHGGKAY